MNKVYLLLGSNLGNRETYLANARKLTDLYIGCLTEESSLYSTESWGKINQPEFINQVICVETAYEPREVLEQILRIENELGRQRIEKWDSRTIDIDILYFNNEIIDEPGLTIPHPFLHERRFTLVPLAELAPEFKHPVNGLTQTELLERLDDQLKVVPIATL